MGGASFAHTHTDIADANSHFAQPAADRKNKDGNWCAFGAGFGATLDKTNNSDQLNSGALVGAPDSAPAVQLSSIASKHHMALSNV